MTTAARGLVLAVAGWLAGVMGASATSAGVAAGPRFEVSIDPGLGSGPFSGRLYVMLAPPGARGEPRFGPSWFNPQPFFAIEVSGWKPGEAQTLDATAVGFPAPLDQIEPGEYEAQALLRLNLDTHSLGMGPGNLHGAVTRVRIDPKNQQPIALAINARVESREFPETERVKLVDIPSPLLSAFHGRPIRMRAGVVLPALPIEAGQKRPALYIIPGFGGSHTMALGLAASRRMGFGGDFVRVVLDPDCGTGHHVFADSANNGPRGRALVEELIPYIEANFPVIADPGARLLTGHSSGGWSSLWLQVAYPDDFGGVWSTSPDPVDFRDFQQINLYDPLANMFVDAAGQRRPLARRGTQLVLWYDDFSKMEDVIGDGGQLHSFEAVFSPRGVDGKPRPLWNRQTGQVDPETARTWEAYDIRLILERDWDRLEPRLKGKLHVFTGSLDTFYLEGAVRLLQESLEKLGSDAVVEVIEGRDHGNLLDAALSERIDDQMHRTVSRFSPAPAGAVGGGGSP